MSCSLPYSSPDNFITEVFVSIPFSFSPGLLDVLIPLWNPFSCKTFCCGFRVTFCLNDDNCLALPMSRPFLQFIYFMLIAICITIQSLWLTVFIVLGFISLLPIDSVTWFLLFAFFCLLFASFHGFSFPYSFSPSNLSTFPYPFPHFILLFVFPILHPLLFTYCPIITLYTPPHKSDTHILSFSYYISHLFTFCCGSACVVYWFTDDHFS